jgi:3-oxoacyl-[acyl-carrier protein] reductase
MGDVMLPDLDGKVAIVTGAGGGIGWAIAEQFASQGVKVVVIGRSAKPLQLLASRIRAQGGSALPIQCDVSEESQVKTAVETTLNYHCRIDILINNAATNQAHRARIQELGLVEWNRVLQTNLTGAMLCAKYVSAHFIERQTGSIVNVSSLAGNVPRLELGAYAVSKAALNHLTRVLALELASDGIRVNAVSPGSTLTVMLTHAMERDNVKAADRAAGDLETYRSRIPLGRLGLPEEQASAVLFLASDAASFITGQVLSVDGGVSIV